ncbi:MAG: insulinase family protein [Bacteroidetes bacterium]|nr:insulinase family protein [Bacteroidota bacterium]
MKNICSKSFVVLLFIGLSFSPLYNYSYCLANRNNTSGDEIQSLPKGVFIHSLDNGMQVLLIENPALPMVGVNVVVKVGSAYETFATSGMSHMLEHLLFNGTDTLTQKELYDATDKIGGYNNANTGEYYTNYMMVTPAENIYEGMILQSAMLFHSILPEEKFEKEKDIVMEEIAKSLANSREQAERNIISIIYKGHALSLPTLGTYETIKNMKRDDVYKFYKNYYLPNNMIMSVIGNFNKDEMIKQIEEIYGCVPPGDVNLIENHLWGTGFEQPKNKLNIEGETFHRFYKGDLLLVNLIYELPCDLTSDFFNLLKLSLSDKADSLQKILDDKFPDKVTKVSFQTRLYPVKKYLEATLKLNEESSLNEIVNFFIVELKKQNLSLAPEIINTEAIKTKTDFYKNIEKPHMFGIYNAGNIGEYGIESVFDSYSQAGYLEAGKLLNDFSITSEPVKIIQHPFISEEDLATDDAIKIELFENGEMKPVIIVKQNNASELLAVHYMIKNKAAYEEKYGKDAAFIWHDTFGQRMKSPENKKESINYGLTFTVNDNPYIPMDNIYLSPAFGYIRVEGLADDVEGAINYLNSQMLNFVPTEREFESAIKKSHGNVMMRKENKAKQVFEDAYKSIIYESEKYVSSSEQLTYEKLLSFGKEYFNPQNMIISVVSPASAEEINNYFTNFEKIESAQPLNDPAYQRKYAEINKARTIIDTVGGEQAYLFYGFLKTVDDNDKAALKALSLLLGDKIVFDVREKQGLAYRMGAGINVIENTALFYINMGTRTENVDKLVPQFPNFFTAEFSNSFTEDELIKRVNMYLGRMMFRRLSSINQAYYLAHSYYFDGDIFADEEMLDALKQVTLQDVNRVVKKYLKVENPVEVIVR